MVLLCSVFAVMEEEVVDVEVVVVAEEAAFNVDPVSVAAFDEVPLALLTPACCAIRGMLERVTDATASRRAVLIAISSETFSQGLAAQIFTALDRREIWGSFSGHWPLMPSHLHLLCQRADPSDTEQLNLFKQAANAVAQSPAFLARSTTRRELFSAHHVNCSSRE
jgi:hypothetical protein